MKKEELDILLKKADEDCINQKNQLIRFFCDANNPYKIGDIFTDKLGSIRIDKIGYYTSFGKHQCTYTGVTLKKDGTETKSKEIRTAWQSNEVKPKQKQAE